MPTQKQASGKRQKVAYITPTAKVKANSKAKADKIVRFLAPTAKAAAKAKAQVQPVTSLGNPDCR